LKLKVEEPMIVRTAGIFLYPVAFVGHTDDVNADRATGEIGSLEGFVEFLNIPEPGFIEPIGEGGGIRHCVSRGMRGIGQGADGQEEVGQGAVT
jgi:hypothetical protein